MTNRRQSIQSGGARKGDSKRDWLSALRVGGSCVLVDTDAPAQFSATYVQFFDQVFKVIRRHFSIGLLSQKCDTARASYHIIVM